MKRGDSQIVFKTLPGTAISSVQLSMSSLHSLVPRAAYLVHLLFANKKSFSRSFFFFCYTTEKRKSFLRHYQRTVHVLKFFQVSKIATCNVVVRNMIKTQCDIS